MLKEWTERPQDVSNLLNPSFLGLLLYRAVHGFKRERSSGMPFELAVLVLPLVLHPTTRNRLPPKITTTLPTWVQANRDLLVEFPKRAKGLLPFTRESLRFLLERSLLLFDGEGRLDIGSQKPVGVTQYQQASDEIGACYRRAEFVGRWLASAGSSATIYVLLGIRP